MKKRLLSLLLAVCLLMSFVPTAAIAAIVNNEDAVAMYRLYNPNSGEHFYTGSEEERDNLVNVGWNYEGVGWYAPIKGGEPIHRFYNPNTGDHHYTASMVEMASLRSVGWQYEGVAWNSMGDFPQYRLFNPNAITGMHHYTGSTEERDYLVSLGWNYEGISWYGIDPMKIVEDSVDPDPTVPEDPTTPTDPEAPTEPAVPMVSVSFYDGTRLIDTLKTEKGTALGAVPSVEKSSKEGAILVGYYLDKEFKQPFYAENPVAADTKVYAKYEDMGSSEVLNFTTFTQMDQAPTVSFQIQKVSGTTDAANAATLIVKDGTDPVELAITGSGNNYTVSAPAGFNEGSSYQLELADGWIFTGKPATIRTASFTIDKEEVENLQMSDDIQFIGDTDAIKYNIGGKSYDELTSSLLSEAGGTFTYDKAADLQPGDIICIYTGKHPNARNNGSDLLDPAVYVKVTSVSGNTVTFTELGAEDQAKMYNIPNNFPILVSELPTGNTGSVNFSALDADMYLKMMGAEKGTVEAAKADMEPGDFISMYVSVDAAEGENGLVYGRITAFNAETGEISFEKCTLQDVMDSVDLFKELDLKGSDMISDAEKAELEAILLEQVEASGFAEEAAYMVADLITKTDNFNGSATVYDYVLKDQNGNELSKENIQLDNLGGKFELTDDVELTVELITKGEQLHYAGGTQLAIGIEAEFEVELESEDTIKIDLSATFIQEVMLDPEVKGSIVWKWVGPLYVPLGVNVGAAIDVKSFTAFSFEAEIYTVEAEDEETWDKIRGIMENPAEALDFADLPEGLVSGLNTVGDVMDKIAELEEMADKAKSTNEQYQGYLDDAAMLWEQVESAGLTTKEDWAAMCDALDQTSITSDLLGMMNLTNETGLSTEYYETIDDLMDRYTEMVEKETDWVTLIEQEIFTAEVNFYGLVIGCEVNFVVSADLSLAIGSNLQYEVGKRYEFWFEIGLFEPTAGSSSMDLIDEQFAFQFYVMGRLGIRAGIKAKMYVGLGTGKFASVGITAELGPYIKLYGFFIYENTKYRPANTSNWISDERMAGALFMEFGLYFKLGFEAEALGKFEYTYDFLDEEIPLVTAGDKYYYYRFDYEAEEDELVVLKDVDNDSTNGITMTLPQDYLSMAYMNLQTGRKGFKTLDLSKYIFTVSNPNFVFDSKTGVISVNVPDGTRYMECDLTATYKHGKVAFSTYDMTVTVPLVWTNLSSAELSEYYTASVRVGNVNDGFTTIWSEKLLKNEEFDLPTEDEVEELVSWSDYIYVAGSGYGDQTTTGLTLIENEVYDFDLDYKTYAITVNGIQNADGSTTSKTYYAKFGETFDFSDLATTGTVDYTNGVFTKFTELTNSKNLDLKNPVNGAFADAIGNGLTVTANYMDNSVTATFEFTDITHDDITVKIPKGDIPSLAAVEAVANDFGVAVKDIYPAIGKMNASTTYQVVLGALEGPEATIAFEENGGSEVADITKVVGSLIGVLPEPTKAGYTFGGWFEDNNTFKIPFEDLKVTEGGATLYAKWTPNKYTVTFHVNGGDALESGKETKEVVFDTAYGVLPEPIKTGSSFLGWFTQQEGGEEVKAADIVAITEDVTLYAHWLTKKDIPETVFDFGDMAETTYEQGVGVDPGYTFTAEEGETYKAEDFTFKFMRQGENEYIEGLPVNAGTYNVTVSRPADGTYAKFEYTYDEVVKINKATRAPKTVTMEQLDAGFTWLKVQLTNDPEPYGGIEDLSSDAQIIFNVHVNDRVYSSEPMSFAGGVLNTTIYNVASAPGVALGNSVTVIDPNYEDWTSDINTTATLMQKAAPTDSWKDEGNYDTSWYNEEDTAFTITTPEQLAGLIILVNEEENSLLNKTFTLANDLDMSAHSWYPIGRGRFYTHFSGSLDGAGHTIYGLYMDLPEEENVGLFGYSGVAESFYASYDHVAAAEIKNLVIDDSVIKGKKNVGGISGAAGSHDDRYAHITNCTSYAQVTGKTNVGGLVGNACGVEISNCIFVGYASAPEYPGYCAGILGYGSGNGHNVVIANCASLGIVEAYAPAAILSSNNYCDVVNVYNAGIVCKTGDLTNNLGTVCSGGADWDYAIVGSTDKKAAEYTFSDAQSGCVLTEPSFYGETLIESMNGYIDEPTYGAYLWYYYVNWQHWIADGINGYPIPVTLFTSSLRK